MPLILNESVAVDVTYAAANADPPLIGAGAVMYIVQNEVVAAFPALEAFKIETPVPPPQDPGPNGVYIKAASEEWLQNAAPPDWENQWALWLYV